METSIKCKTFTNTKLWILYNMLNAVYQIGDWSCKFSLKNDSPLAMETSLEHWIILTLNMTNGYHKKGSRKIFFKLKIQCPTHVEKILVKRRGSWLLVLFVCGFFFFCSYNKLFRFLLKVKQTQLDLQQVWAAYMGTKHLSTAQLSNMTKIWLSRMHMAFLVDNLQYYLQVTYLQLKILIKRKFWN